MQSKRSEQSQAPTLQEKTEALGKRIVSARSAGSGERPDESAGGEVRDSKSSRREPKRGSGSKVEADMTDADHEHKAIASEVQEVLRSVESDVVSARDAGLKEMAATLSRRVSTFGASAGEADRKALATDLHALVVRSGIAHDKVVAARKEELSHMEEQHRDLRGDHSGRRESAHKHAEEAAAVKEEMARIVDGMDKLEERRQVLGKRQTPASSASSAPSAPAAAASSSR